MAYFSIALHPSLVFGLSSTLRFRLRILVAVSMGSLLRYRVNLHSDTVTC